MDDETVAFIESGCALILGVVGPANEPVAARGWGADVISTDGSRVRVLVDADDGHAIDLMVPGARIAMTGAAVPTLRSLQGKGHIVATSPASSDDPARVDRYCDDFFGDIVATDHIQRDVLERWVPMTFARVVIDVEEWFDQTPGPGAGREVTR